MHICYSYIYGRKVLTKCDESWTVSLESQIWKLGTIFLFQFEIWNHCFHGDQSTINFHSKQGFNVIWVICVINEDIQSIHKTKLNISSLHLKFKSQRGKSNSSYHKGISELSRFKCKKWLRIDWLIWLELFSRKIRWTITWNKNGSKENTSLCSWRWPKWTIFSLSY